MDVDIDAELRGRGHVDDPPHQKKYALKGFDSRSDEWLQKKKRCAGASARGEIARLGVRDLERSLLLADDNRFRVVRAA
jgi:hypothetical protein